MERVSDNYKQGALKKMGEWKIQEWKYQEQVACGGKCDAGVDSIANDELSR